MAPIQPSHPHVRAARRRGSWTPDTSDESWRNHLPRHSALQQLFRQSPSVPSRELERIRLVLLHCDEIAHTAATHRLSEPAQALLDLVTGELERRRESGHHQPLNSSPASRHPGLPKLAPVRRRGELL